MLKLLSLLLFVSLANCVTYDDTTFFLNNADLDIDKKVNLKWNVTADEILFRLNVKSTNGWVGFGVSPNGGMFNSDLMVAWTSPNGTNQFTDAHSDPKINKIYRDTVQNWKRLFYGKANGETTVIFSRKIKVCPAPGQPAEEINLNFEPTTFVIYAYGENLENDFPTYHGKTRGSTNLPLLVPSKKIELDWTKFEQTEFKIDLTLPDNISTTYWCGLNKIPSTWSDTKRHLVRFDAIMDPKVASYSHHYLMYQCDEGVLEAELTKSNLTIDDVKADFCYVNKMWINIQQKCRKVILGWAVGGDLAIMSPENIAFPIGGKTRDFTYFYFQMHLENPDFDKNVNISTGFKFYTTTDYRKIEAGVLTIGSSSSPRGIILPPKAKALSLEYMCRNSILQNIFGDTGEIQVFSHLPHTHLAGRQIFSKVVRNGSEVEYISNNKYYSFANQYYNTLPKPVTIKKGDELILNCVFNTEDRTKFTLGGFGTQDEMCMNFLWYYPKSSNPTAGNCFDIPSPDQWVNFYAILNSTGVISWKYNSSNFDGSIQDAISAIEKSYWMKNPELMEKKIQEFYKNASRFETDLIKISVDTKAPIKVTRLVEPACEKSDQNDGAERTTTISAPNDGAERTTTISFPIILIISVLRFLF